MKTSDKTIGGPLGWIRSWVFLSGEQVVVAAGAWLAVLLVLIVLASGSWTLWVQRQAIRQAQRNGLVHTAEVLAKAVGPVVEQGELGTVQSLLSETAAQSGLERGSVRIASGKVLASTEESDLSVERLPKEWGKASKDLAGISTSDDGQLVARGVCEVVGRGDVVVELATRDNYSVFGQRSALMGIGILGASSLGGGLLVYRLLRSRLRALGAIQESLRYASQFEEGELPTTGLRLADDYGEEALAWNRLLSERDRLKQKDKLERAAERMRSHTGATGDYAAAFDAVWQGLIVLDDQCKVRAINGAAVAVFGVQKQDVVGKPLAGFVPFTEVTSAASLVVSGQQRQRASFEVSPENTAGNAERTILRVTLRPMRREDGCAAIIVLEDVTQQRVASESRNAFVASATHELRTPLTSMKLHLEQLTDAGDDPLVKARSMNVLTSETRRLERIVGDMLSLAEMDAGTFSLRTDDVDPQELFKELEQDYLATAADKEIELRFEAPPKWPSVCADRDKVGMAMHNLVSNALKYTPVGGRVTVRASDDHGSLVFEVSDNGIGISAEEQELVFEKFYRSKDKRVASIVGSGIGLSLAREVIRLHGGDIRLESQIDKGSTFTLTLPPRAASAGASRMAA